MNSTTKLNLNEQFPHLNHAPIAEAIIEVRTQASAPWEEDSVSKEIQQELPDYPIIQPLNTIRHEFKVEPGQQPKPTVRDLGWRGLRCETEDKLQVAQFYRDSFVFSRLQPYEDWESFHAEAMRLWRIYQFIARTEQVDRLGLRFINRICVPQSSFELEDSLSVAPKAPDGIDYPFVSFFQQDSFQVPDHPYGVSLIKTIQEADRVWLILDVDVFTTQPIDAGQLDDSPYLQEMRWLKNKFFFSSITDKAKEEMQ